MLMPSVYFLQHPLLEKGDTAYERITSRKAILVST
jgi:hypothetical protein